MVLTLIILRKCLMKRYYCLLKNFTNWWLYLAYKYGFSSQNPLVFKTRNGVLVEVPSRLLHTFKEIFMEEGYLAGLEKKPSPHPVILDIGANAGYFSLFAVSKYDGASVFAYEPIPSNYKQLLRNADLNGSRRISCFPLAVAGHCGEISLVFDNTDSFTTSATVLSSNSGANDSIRVECVDLKKIFDDNRIEKCDLLKLDCEGAEYDILYSCPEEYLKRIDQIAMEVHRGEKENMNMDALASFLSSRGFFTRRCGVGMLWAWRA